MKNYQSAVEDLLIPQGIQISQNTNADVLIHDPRFYARVLRDGSLGLGESYMDAWWDSPHLDAFLYKLLTANLEQAVGRNFKLFLLTLQSKVFNLQSIYRANRVAQKHYDLGNDLFEMMLDSHLQYSCAYWQNAKNLEEAQERKLALICEKLKLAPGQKLLDIGCGWGGLAAYAAKNYEVEVTGITISKNQAILAKKRCEGLPVDIRLQDYRYLNQHFDRVVSVGMFEHVGYKNYAAFMEITKRCLKKDGLFLLHCIGGQESVTKTDAWIHQYIFPNGMMPSAKQIGQAIENSFVIQDWHNFGNYYDYTLMAWLKNFKKGWHLISKNYDERFYRMWEYYLCISAASFRAKKNHLWQIVLTHPHYPYDYEAVR
ncbi:cyclopropane fatty acyl phospholipid synthase [Pelobium sp.]|nr:cyclopropane fatty acyl phospholipid synthase [Pelobium sp.]MDA9555602.1 cyclopropane fatty acyl phospholipid synthase [Pelobium sp.]